MGEVERRVGALGRRWSVKELQGIVANPSVYRMELLLELHQQPEVMDDM